jgi:molybdenum cofactor cytidylyltransferase
MGAFKPLLPFGSASVVETTVGYALAAGCRVILVVGYRGAQLASLFAGRPGLLVVENPAWEKGMLGSLQTGLKCVASPCFFTIPADMPLVGCGIYELVERAREADQAAEQKAQEGIPPAVPTAGTREPAAYFASHGGRAGHPVLIPSSWIPEMLELPPSGKMRSYLERRRMVLVEAGTDAVFADLDGPEEYRAASASYGAL